jgi:hypothetical protein
MDYTPRQLQAFLFLADRRRRRELREELDMNRHATHANEQAMRAYQRNLEN